MQRIAINGFGRIGRTVLRAWLRGDWPGLEIVAINDIASPEDCAYLLEFDSVFGPLDADVRLEDGAIIVGTRRLRLTRAPDLSDLDLRKIDLVLECTGGADRAEVAQRGLRAGARRVLISGPSDAAEITIVLGANHHLLTADHRVISNASCTTNALAPLAHLLDTRWGLRTGFMTTVHCYTGSQPTVDAPRGDPARSRAAGLSMVPTTTSAQYLLERVLPDLRGRLMGAAVRVPTASVSAVDLTVLLDQPVSVDEVNAAFRQAGGVMGWTDRPLVSTDLRARRESVIMALPETRQTEAGLLRVFGWYDNEWGFSCRLLDMAQRFAKL